MKKSINIDRTVSKLKENWYKEISIKTLKAKDQKSPGLHLYLNTLYIQLALKAGGVDYPNGDGWFGVEDAITKGYDEVQDLSGKSLDEIISWCDKNCIPGDIAFMTNENDDIPGYSSMCFERNKGQANFGSDYNHTILEKRNNIRVGPCRYNDTPKRIKIFRYINDENSEVQNIVFGDTSFSLINEDIGCHMSSRKGYTVQYLAIHYTAGGNSKQGHAKNSVFKTFKSRNASADFCVDDVDIVCYNTNIPSMYCWAVGDKASKAGGGASLQGKAFNRNTISIEISSTLASGRSAKHANTTGWSYTAAALNNAVKLASWLMQQYNIPIDRVVRHYDISGKLCPGIVGWNDGPLYDDSGRKTGQNNSNEWLKFKNRLGGNYSVTNTSAKATVTQAPQGKDNYRGTELKVIALQEESSSLSNALADLSALSGLQEEYEAQQSSDSFSIINKMSDFSVSQSDLYT